MKEIVVAFGTHRHSTRALEWATMLAKRAGVRVVVLNVFHPEYIEMTHADHLARIVNRKDHINDVMASLGHDDFEILVKEGEPVAELASYAFQRKSDLIVVGYHGTSAPGGFGEHGATDALLRTSRTPFMVVKDDAQLPADDGARLTIVVGVDGKEANADSVDAIGHLAEALGAQTVPVFAVSTGVSTTRNHYGSQLIHEDDAKAIADRLPNATQMRLINESPIEGLIDAANDADAALIAIGTRGHLDLSDLFAGQLGRHLIAESDRPVLIAPHH